MCRTNPTRASSGTHTRRLDCRFIRVGDIVDIECKVELKPEAGITSAKGGK
jgi:hypothetical protein